MAETTCLLNMRARNRTGGSNPPLSAKSKAFDFAFETRLTKDPSEPARVFLICGQRDSVRVFTPKDRIAQCV